MPKYRYLALASAAALAAAGTLMALPSADAAVTQTAQCTDGGDHLWTIRTTWGSVRSGKIAVTATGFNSTAPDATTADWSMRTFNADGTVAQVTGGQDTPVSNKAGEYLERNLIDPTGGGARVAVSVGDGNDGEANCTVSFTAPTSAPPASDPVVAAVGDMVCAPGASVTPATCSQKAVSDRILAEDPDALLALGDLQYESGTLSDFNSAYGPSFGRLRAITKPIPGNHEYKTSDADGYYDYFGALAGDRTKGYYSFDIGEWHFVALNSEKSISATGAQIAWLEADLAANRKNCVAAMLHKPRWSTGAEHGDNPRMQPFVDALTTAKADLLLSGHDHGYERFYPLNRSGVRDDANGITQIVSGLGGKNRKPVAGRETTAARTSETHGYTRLVLHPNSADISFVPVGGTYTDQKKLTCHGGPQ